MALPDNPISLADLNSDCLLQIFSYLQLEDLVNLRYQCSTLNTVVCSYLPRVTSLSIVLSKEHASWEDREWPHYERMKRILKDWFGDERYYSLRTYGRRNFTILEDNTMLESQRHFRLEDFIVIRDRQKFERFKEFVQKYNLAKIENLALIMDHRNYLPEIAKLLQLWPKVKVLLLDRTHQCVGKNFPRASLEGWDLKEIFTSIKSLSSLNELHFFARRCAAFNICNLKQPVYRLEELFRTFISVMFNRLEVFYINHDGGDCFGQDVLEYSLPEPSYGNVQELGMPLSYCLTKDSIEKFKNLRSISLLGYWSSWVDNWHSFERLETLKFYTVFHLSKRTMQFLNSLPSLKYFSVERFYLEIDFYSDKRWFRRRVIDDQYVNKTIKHLTIELPNKHNNPSKREYVYTDFFQGLVTITASRPEVTVYKKKGLNKLRLYY